MRGNGPPNDFLEHCKSRRLHEIKQQLFSDRILSTDFVPPNCPAADDSMAKTKNIALFVKNQIQDRRLSILQ